MTSEYEFIPEDILREIASYSLTPRMERVSSPIKRIEESLLPTRIAYLDRVYPGWNQKVNIFVYAKRGNVFEKMVQNHDLDAIQLVLRLHTNPSSVINALVYQGIQQEAVDILQFLVKSARNEDIKRKIRREIIDEAAGQNEISIIPLFVSDDYPIELVVYTHLLNGKADTAALLALLQNDQSKLKLLDLVASGNDDYYFKQNMKKLAKYGDYTYLLLDRATQTFIRKIKSF